MSLVKICGLMRECDVDFVNKYKPDYTGFVISSTVGRFRRQITVEQASLFRKKLCKSIKAVGVFVNEPIEYIAGLCDNNIIDIIQLHGDETEDYIQKLKKTVCCPIIKAVRAQSPDQIAKAEKLSCDYLLLDTCRKNAYGGTGESFNWDIIPKLSKPFFLAGGLNAQNVASAIKSVNPYCVDLSSGAETDGLKDENKIMNIVNTVRRTK